uniref:EF-hand domain-containing protein n=1 Tax=Pavo cristatus TaxID=9049 RepID=A0A8C9FJ97_PAVCR
MEFAPKKAKKKVEGGSNVFSMFEQTQIQEFKEAFTIMDQNRDGFIDKADLRDTFAALGKLVAIIKYLKETVVCIRFSWGNNEIQKAKGNLFSLIFLLYGSCCLDYVAPAAKSPEQPLSDTK